ncbi:MAG: DUF2505 family protein [Sandaracinaceae bacterium]
MSKTRDTRISLPAPPEAVVEALTSEAFLIDRETSQGALEVAVSEASRDENELVQVVRMIRYAHGFGGIDRSRTEESEIRIHWDLPARSATWSHTGPHSDRAAVSGTLRIEPEGAGSALVETLVIDVRVPFIGGRIASMILKGMNKGFPTYEQVVRRHVEG